MRYDRTVLAYHGCDATTADRLLAGEPFQASQNAYDWLGRGIYFWEYGYHRAWRFAEFQKSRGKVQSPAVVGVVLQLGQCFDLLDTRFTANLAAAYPVWAQALTTRGVALPTNRGAAPDHKLRHLDCAVLNWYLDLAASEGNLYETVRGGFQEGGPVYEGACIYLESHIQLAVRDPRCILGVFRPSQETP